MDVVQRGSRSGVPGVSPQRSALTVSGGEGAAPLSFWEAAPAVLWDYSPEALGSCALWAGRAGSTPGRAREGAPRSSRLR